MASDEKKAPRSPHPRTETGAGAGAAATTAAVKAGTGSAVRGASLLIMLQIVSRAVTFVANQLLLRFLTAQLLGVSTQLEVYYLSVLFFARESLRVAIQRQGSSSSTSATTATDTSSPTAAADGKEPDEDSDATTTARDSQAVVNIAHLSLVLGLAAAAGLGWMYMRYVDTPTAGTPYLETSLRIYGVAAILELLSEPAFVVLQHRLRFGPRAAAESTATFLRCVATFGAAHWAWRHSLDLGVLPFACGQLAYGLGLLTVYAWYGLGLAWSEGFSLLPRRTPPKRDDNNNNYVLGYFYKPTLRLASSLTAQSLVKHVLTQGDTFLVSVLSDPRSQGVYALANNYGGLLARLVFQPIEESSRNYFSKLLSTDTSTTTDSADSAQEVDSGESRIISSSSSTPSAAVIKARDNLRALLRFYVLLGILVVSIGPYAAPLLVQIVAGSRWSASGAGGVLARYCLYIPLLAINGVAEAFVSSVATKEQIHRQSLWMGLFSVAFGVAGFAALRVLGLGAAGLVYANAVNMLCRIGWSAGFVSRYFAGRGVEFAWGGVVPDGAALYVAGTAALWATLGGLGISVGGTSPHVFTDLVTVAMCAVPHVALV
ncbi:hypothetical protein DL762_001341 [Monosporascus cannonballus]|uniref:Man(5)GlcNAc(2)-PP-dolichol translocation protein RFT1 n=1 Tax=Monosporascus cannonballus TaxID=155416 RepID=A0ABY0HGK8_9PEZI|nr:hypothetical protein DL762_001341 [Monosporascus cannonballus]RYP00388.1 hypothetical protein DL763_000854 [Monosporascus cannonballus]